MLKKTRRPNPADANVALREWQRKAEQALSSGEQLASRNAELERNEANRIVAMYTRSRTAQPLADEIRDAKSPDSVRFVLGQRTARIAESMRDQRLAPTPGTEYGHLPESLRRRIEDQNRRAALRGRKPSAR